jgi:hypothetical protein
MVEITAGRVEAVHVSPSHTMSKPSHASIRLVEGLGVEGDAHAGKTVKHRSRVKRDPSQPNLRQVHLIHGELHDELRASGFEVAAGQMGENITTREVDLLGLPTGTTLKIGDEAIVEVTGLRNPCAQLDGIQPGLMKAVLDRDDEGNLVRRRRSRRRYRPRRTAAGAASAPRTGLASSRGRDVLAHELTDAVDRLLTFRDVAGVYRPVVDEAFRDLERDFERDIHACCPRSVG